MVVLEDRRDRCPLLEKPLLKVRPGKDVVGSLAAEEPGEERLGAAFALCRRLVVGSRSESRGTAGSSRLGRSSRTR